MTTAQWRKVKWAGCVLARHDVMVQTNLPWRQIRTPYRVLLAEMLLVRTRWDVVARMFEDFVARYPNPVSLAHADFKTLSTYLYPLGLSKRARYFAQAGQYICEVYGGNIPNQFEDLLKIPGVGEYTAKAVLAFAYDQPVVPSDVNILRFLSRLTGLNMDNRTKGSERLRELTHFMSEAETGLPPMTLLDFTRFVCKHGTPNCDKCPLKKHCSYFRQIVG